MAAHAPVPAEEGYRLVPLIPLCRPDRATTWNHQNMGYFQALSQTDQHLRTIGAQGVDAEALLQKIETILNPDALVISRKVVREALEILMHSESKT
ncbi:hypothetical protein HYZ99_02895 [Candidatus Peregrinibacteria bacterium]|nr:hypothetical protein [Candidatus Peregrinibacteria bacterium]